MVDDDGLQELDEMTDWDIEEELPPDDEDSLVVAEEDGDLDGPESVPNILSCVSDMEKNGIIESVVFIINTNENDQLLFTTLERNDLIVGTLQTAILNWYSTQRDLQMYEDEGGEEEIGVD